MNVNNNQNDDPRHHGADNAGNGLGSGWCLYGGGTANSASVGAAAFDTNHEADDEEENERVLQQQEEEEQTAAIAAATARRKHRSLRERQKLASILDDTNYHRLPLRQRKKINELVDDFLSQLGDDIHDMCTDQRAGANYNGLDSQKDTEEEVETALRFYPNTLRTNGIRAGTNLYPIQYLTEMHNLLDGIVCQNVKAVSFIHLFARLAIEFGTFDEQERGGLLIRDSINRNVLHRLVNTSRHSDNLFHTEMVKLKRAGLFLKKDIMDFGLLSHMCQSCKWWFSEQKAKFIIDWDQNSLYGRVSSDGKIPLHHVADYQSTKGFRFLLDHTMQYFGKETGIAMLCLKDNANKTPLRIACKKWIARILL